MEKLSRAFEGCERERHRDAHKEHHEAFEHSVTFAVTGVEGPVVASMREHWCRELIARAGPPGAMSTEEAIVLCEEVCYGPLTKEIASMVIIHRGLSCKNAPGEMDQALRLLGGCGVW